LLYGPPGCGKTLIVKRLARLLGFNYMEVGPSTVGSIYVHGTQGKIQELFEEAYKNKPTVVFIDEFESFVPNRNRDDLGFHYQSEVNEFLYQLNTAFERRIFIIAATNYIENIDPAILRPGRIDKKIFVGPPDYEARLEAFKMYLKGIPHNVKRWDFLAEETEYYTFAEIEFVIAEAKRSALEKESTIDLNILMQAVLSNPPYLNDENISKYI
jgi:transitional endoplasmic reticulum ATPase